MQVFIQNLGVQLRFTIDVDGAPANLVSPTPLSIDLLVDGAVALPLDVDPGDNSVAVREVAAGDFQRIGSFDAVVRLTYDAEHVFHSVPFPFQVSSVL